MRIENLPSGVTAVTFDGDYESESVRRAFEEHNSYRTDRGNSLDEFDIWAASWPAYKAKFRCRCFSLLPLIDPLEYFVDNTEEQVDELLDAYLTGNWSPETRIKAAAYRYRLMDVAMGNLATLLDYVGEDDSALAIY